jgi:hypothetical protein
MCCGVKDARFAGKSPTDAPSRMAKAVADCSLKSRVFNVFTNKD